MTENPQDETRSEEPQNPTSAFGAAFKEFAEHQRRAFQESGKALESLFPESFREHGAAARSEFKKGLKILVDATIDELEKVTKADPPDIKVEKPDGDDEPPSTTGKTKVKVQVD